MRSMTASRGASTANTLTYDEVAILFKVRSLKERKKERNILIILQLRLYVCMYVCMYVLQRFQGSARGTVQYAGPLMDLLDMPSWYIYWRRIPLYIHTYIQTYIHKLAIISLRNVAVRKLIQAYKIFGDHEGFRLVNIHTYIHTYIQYHTIRNFEDISA